MNCPNCGAIPATRITATTCGYPICAKCGRAWPEGAAPDNPHCAICGQLHGLTMADLVEQDTSLPVYCGDCEARICEDHGRLDCGSCSATAAPQGESVRLFEPAPVQLEGQTFLGL